MPLQPANENSAWIQSDLAYSHHGLCTSDSGLLPVLTRYLTNHNNIIVRSTGQLSSILYKSKSTTRDYFAQANNGLQLPLIDKICVNLLGNENVKYPGLSRRDLAIHTGTTYPEFCVVLNYLPLLRKG